MFSRRLFASAVALSAVVTAACSTAPTAPSAAASASGAASPAIEPAGPTSAGANLVAYPYSIRTAYTVTGTQTVGSVVTLHLTLTNTSGVDDPYGGFGWILLSNQLKRTNTPVGGNPKVLCEAYRGHQGGLTQAVYDDFCRVWVTGPIAAGQSIDLAFPVKLLSEGTWPTVAEMTWGQPDAQGYYPNLVRLTQDIAVAPAPPKVGGGGGGTTSSTPDIQATVKTSSGSTAVGGTVLLFPGAKNSGKVIANNVPVTTTVPAGLSIAYAYDAGGQPCAVNGNIVTCTIAYLLSGQSIDVTVAVTGTAPGSFTIPFAVGAPTEGDSNLSNNATSTSITVK